MPDNAPIHPHYPTPSEVDAWCADVRAWARAAALTATWTGERAYTPRLGLYHTRDCQFVRFSAPQLGEFCGYWQQAVSHPAPLVVHLPGYGHEVRALPELCAAGFHVLDIEPMGYLTPAGYDDAKRDVRGDWPVLADTVRSRGRDGYRRWLAQACAAIAWASTLERVLPGRTSVIGTSQGGGTALLLTSVLRGDGLRCAAADVPFLTHFPLAAGRGAYRLVDQALYADGSPEAWRAAGLVDTCAHAHRLDLPVLLTASGDDTICPPETVEALFARLPSTRSLTWIAKAGHRHTVEFLHLAMAWLRLHG